MGEIVEINRQNIESANNTANTALAQSGDPIISQPKGDGFFGSAYETYMQETWVGNALRYGLDSTDDPSAYKETKSDFNPYRYFVDNKKDLQDMQPHVLNGLFDNVWSEAQFTDRVGRLRMEQENRKALENGSTAGQIAGGLMSFADISTFVPGINLGKKLNTATKLGKVLTSRPVRWAATGAYVSAAQEAGLHAFQNLRTLDESEMNVAFGAGLGGTLGTIGNVAGKTSLLNPKNPNYIFNPDNKVVMGVKALGSKVSESPAFEPVIRGGKNVWDTITSAPIPGTGASVGAAAVKGVELAKAGGEALGGIVKPAIQAIGRAGQAAVKHTLAKATPIGRGLQATSEKVRNLTASMYDLGGVLLDGHQRGHYIQSFEDVAEGFKRNIDMLQVGVREAYVGLQMRLAELQGKSVSAAGVAMQDIAGDVRAFGRDVAAGPAESGRARPNDYSQKGGRLDRAEFETLIENQMREDVADDVVQNLKDRFGDEGATNILDTAKRIGEVIHAHNANIEQQLVDAGLLKEKDRLGREYVAPQLWSSRGIRANKARAKEFFMRLFAKDPSDDFLEANAITREQYNKLGKDTVKIGEKEYDVNAGLAFKNDLLGDWSGFLRDDKFAQLELELKAAEADFELKRKEAILASRELRMSDTDVKHATVEEAEAVLKARMAQAEKAKANLALKQKELMQTRAALAEAEARWKAENPEQALLDRVNGQAQRDHAGNVAEAEQLHKMISEDPNSSKLDVLVAKNNLVEADNNQWADGVAAEGAAKDGRKFEARVAALRETALREQSKYKERIDTLAREIYKLESAIKRLEKPVERLNKAATDAKAARGHMMWVRKLRNEAANEAKKEAKAAGREVKRSTKRLRKFKGETVEEYVDNLLDTLSQRSDGLSPVGIIDSAFMESGRTKLRFIKMNNEQRREAQALGILRQDLMGSLMEGTTDIGRQIAMRTVYGHEGATNDEIVKNIVKGVEEDYDRLILKAQQENKPRVVKRLEAEKRTFIGENGADGDIVKGFKRQMGKLDLPTDSESMLGWFVSKAREFNFIRYGSGFLISSLTDVSNMVMTTGFGSFSYRTGKALNRTIEGMANPEIRRMVAALELVMHNSRNFKMNSVDDMRNMTGMGDLGTTKHYLTSGVDRAFNGMSQTTSYLSGMMWWNTRLKMAAMIEMQHQFVESAKIYDKLLAEASAGNKASELKIAQLASLGLGSDQMRNVQKMLAKHNPAQNDGLWELGMHRWLKEGDVGQRAYDDVLSALDHVSSRAVMTPSKGDTPFLMSNGYFKMLLQFQTYGFAIINRFLMPGFQRMANYGDMEAFMSFGLALAMGGAVTSAKDILNDGKIKDRSALQWGYDAIDRAGFLAFTSSYLSAAVRTLGGDTSRYSKERNRLAQILGPTGALVQDSWDLVDGVAAGDVDRAKKAAWKLAPLSMYRNIYDLAAGNK